MYQLFRSLEDSLDTEETHSGELFKLLVAPSRRQIYLTEVRSPSSLCFSHNLFISLLINAIR